MGSEKPPTSNAFISPGDILKIPILQGGKARQETGHHPGLPFPSILPSGSGECEQYNQYHSYYHSRGGNVCGFPP